jgi:hypothetical protein
LTGRNRGPFSICAALSQALEARTGQQPGSVLPFPAWSGRVQVTGMVAVQLGVSVDDALLALRAFAAAHGLDLADVAAEVTARRLRFGP